MFLFDDVSFIQTQGPSVSGLWYFLPFGYLATVLIESPILLIGLTRKLRLKQRLLCGFWLTACTYPIVVLVLPTIFAWQARGLYLLVAETFAPLAECSLFWLAFRGRNLLDGADWLRSFIAIIIANLASFGLGEVLHAYEWFGLF